MARLKNFEIGKISGKVGNFVYKVRNGKQFVSLAPSYYSVSDSPASKEKRDRFGACSKIASKLAKDDLLKSLWFGYDSYTKRNAYQKISKFIYNYVNEEGRLTNLMNITPEKGAFPNVEEVSVSSDSIKVVVNPFFANENRGKCLCVSCFAFFSGSRIPFKPENRFELIFSCKTEYYPDDKMSVNCFLDGALKNLMEMHGRSDFVFQFYLVDERGLVNEYSNIFEKSFIQNSNNFWQCVESE